MEYSIHLPESPPRKQNSTIDSTSKTFALPATPKSCVHCNTVRIIARHAVLRSNYNSRAILLKKFLLISGTGGSIGPVLRLPPSHQMLTTGREVLVLNQGMFQDDLSKFPLIRHFLYHSQSIFPSPLEDLNGRQPKFFPIVL